VALAYDTRKVDPLMGKYEAQKTALQDVTEDYALKIRKDTPIEKRRQVRRHKGAGGGGGGRAGGGREGHTH
jgi:hypothetical protein